MLSPSDELRIQASSMLVLLLDAIEKTLGDNPELTPMRVEATRGAMVGYLRIGELTIR